MTTMTFGLNLRCFLLLFRFLFYLFTYLCFSFHLTRLSSSFTFSSIITITITFIYFLVHSDLCNCPHFSFYLPPLALLLSFFISSEFLSPYVIKLILVLKWFQEINVIYLPRFYSHVLSVKTVPWYLYLSMTSCIYPSIYLASKRGVTKVTV